MGLYGQTGIFLKVENGELSVEQFLDELNLQARQQANNNDSVKIITFKMAQWAWKGYLDNVELFRLKNLEKLKSRYNVLLLSNINPFVVEWASKNSFSGDGHSINYYFNKLFYSYEMHDYKPSFSIFNKLIEEARINPKETLFLDDGKKNIEMASSLGMYTIHVKENEDWMPALIKQLDI